MDMLRSSLGSVGSRARAFSSEINPPPPPSSSSSPSSPSGGAKRERGRERDALEAQINDRDRRIARLEHEVKHYQTELVASKRDLDEVRLRQLEHAHMHGVEVARRKREARAASARVKVYRLDMEDTASLKGYADLIREAAPASVDSQYVLKLQKQIQKADDRMEAQRDQMSVIKQTSDEVMETLTAEMCEVVEEKSRVEIDMANQTKILRKEKAESEHKLKAELERVEKRLSQATKKLKRLAEEDEHDEGDKDEGSGSRLASVASENGSSADAGESKAAKLKYLQDRLEEVKIEGNKTEEELCSTLKSRRDEIARLKEASY